MFRRRSSGFRRRPMNSGGFRSRFGRSRFGRRRSTSRRSRRSAYPRPRGYRF